MQCTHPLWMGSHTRVKHSLSITIASAWKNASETAFLHKSTSWSKSKYSVKMFSFKCSPSRNWWGSCQTASKLPKQVAIDNRCLHCGTGTQATNLRIREVLDFHNATVEDTILKAWSIQKVILSFWKMIFKFQSLSLNKYKFTFQKNEMLRKTLPRSDFKGNSIF